MTDMDRPKSRLAPALIVVGILFVMLAAYAAGYFAFSETPTPDNGIRVFNAPWQAFLYAPATRVESWITGEQVHPGCRE
jgi:hypothetical protein